MNEHRHLPALDGLRGLAVLSVVVYHAWPGALPGGWLGVSVFFTLSGFLITRILLTEHTAARSLAAFWRRRVRRLLPAAVATIAATVVAAMAIDRDVDATLDAALAATLYVHNWWAAATGDGYWEIFESPSPLAHMWSLAIEEQVYVVWPLLVVALGGRRALLAGGAIVAAGYLVWWGAADAYYATPVRFGEVLAGAAVAVAVRHRSGFRVGPPLALAAAVTIGLLAVTLPEDDPLVAEGVLLGVAVAAAVVVAWSITDRHRADRLLGGPALGWLGRRSYAIYLFHWPLLVLVDAPPALAVAAAFALAELSHHVLEGPIRRGTRVRRPVLVFGGATLALTAAVGIAAVAHHEVTDADIEEATAAALAQPAPTSADLPPPSTTAAAPAVAEAVGPAPTTTSDPAPILPVAVPAQPAVLLVGDSAAFEARAAFTGWVEANDGSATIRAWGACSPAFGPDSFGDWSTPFFDALDEPCRPAVTGDTDLVVVMDHGAAFIDHRHRSTGEWHDITDDVLGPVITSAYLTMVEEAAVAGAQVLILSAPTPVQTGLLPGYTTDRLDEYRELVATVAREPHVFVLDVGPVVDRDAERYPRTDGLHLDADSGAVNLFVDLVAPAVIFAD